MTAHELRAQNLAGCFFVATRQIRVRNLQFRRQPLDLRRRAGATEDSEKNTSRARRQVDYRPAFCAVTVIFLRAVANSGRSSPTAICVSLWKYSLAACELPAASAALAAPWSALKRLGATFSTALYSAKASCG